MEQTPLTRQHGQSVLAGPCIGGVASALANPSEGGVYTMPASPGDGVMQIMHCVLIIIHKQRTCSSNISNTPTP